MTKSDDCDVEVQIAPPHPPAIPATSVGPQGCPRKRSGFHGHERHLRYPTNTLALCVLLVVRNTQTSIAESAKHSQTSHVASRYPQTLVVSSSRCMTSHDCQKVFVVSCDMVAPSCASTPSTSATRGNPLRTFPTPYDPPCIPKKPLASQRATMSSAVRRKSMRSARTKCDGCPTGLDKPTHTVEIHEIQP